MSKIASNPPGSEGFGNLGASALDSSGQFRFTRSSEPTADDLGLSGNKVACWLEVERSLESGICLTIVRCEQACFKLEIGEEKACMSNFSCDVSIEIWIRHGPTIAFYHGVHILRHLYCDGRGLSRRSI